MFNKDNVFIAVNEEVSSIIQQYIIREIKKVLDKYKSITTEEISSVEKLINSISNEELKEEFLNDWSMSVKIAKEVGENEVDDLKESKEIELDYLQVFKIRRNNEELIIEHTQEAPEYKKIYTFNKSSNLVEEDLKVFIIDENDYNIMLLAEEY